MKVKPEGCSFVIILDQINKNLVSFQLGTLRSAQVQQRLISQGPSHPRNRDILHSRENASFVDPMPTSSSSSSRRASAVEG